MNPVGIGIIGMGFMGQTHARAFLADQSGPGKLLGVCDGDADRRSGVVTAAGNIGSPTEGERLFPPGTVTGYAEADALLADPRIHLVSICTPTDSHAELATRALRAGKHVLVEKPVATDPHQIERLIAESDRAGRLCIPAMCMRHWPGWSDLQTIIRSGEFGPVLHARFDRLGSAPRWGRGFYTDDSRSGGAIFDLHIHDVDIVCWLFGTPSQVRSIGRTSHVATQYIYPDGPGVHAEGGWLSDPAFPFRMSFVVEFERAVVTFDSAASPCMTVFADGASHPVSLPAQSGYDRQASAVVRALASGDASPLPTLHEALSVTRVILAERDSLRARAPVDIPDLSPPSRPEMLS